ncbi:MAG: prepilin-type N-terminal cleavage/methylation domain-containing protein [Candidatus Tumulicola sp.]
MEGQRGFSLVEILVASAIAFILGWQLLALAHATVFGAAHLDQRLRARSAAEQLEERLESDAASAWSIFVPDNDVTGANNGDGHELDFVTENASHHSFWWAYDYDAATQRVTKYAYAPGNPPVAGDAYDGLTAFEARAHPITDLAKPSNAAYDLLFAGADVTAVEVPYGWNPAAAGGNRLVRVRLAASGVNRVALLASATAPSHFTIVVDYTPAPAPPSP